MAVDLSIVSQIAIIMTGFATLATVLFAVYRWYRMTAMATARQIRNDIAQARDALTIEITEFQSIVAQIAQRIFNPNKQETRSIAQMFIEMTKMAADRNDFKKMLENVDDAEIHSWVSDSLVPDLYNVSNIVPLRVLSRLFPLKSSMPVLYTYVSTLAMIALAPFRKEFHIPRIIEYIKSATELIYDLWWNKEPPFQDGILTLEKYLLAWRSATISLILRVREGVNHIDIHNIVIFSLLIPMIDHYLARGDSELLRIRGEEVRVKSEQFERDDPIDTLSAVIRWRLRKYSDLAAQLNTDLGRLKQMLRPG